MVGNEDPVEAYETRFKNRIDEKYIRQRTAPKVGVRKFELKLSLYPDPVTEATLSIVHVEQGDSSETNVRYEEDWSGKRWACRWGRHPNPHNARDHFHYPPDEAEGEDPPACDGDYGREILMMDTVAEFIRERTKHLWQTPDPDYPEEYTWENEYQPDQYEPPDGDNP